MISIDPEKLFYIAGTLFILLCAVLAVISKIKGFDLLKDTRDTVQCLKDAAILLGELDTKLEEVQALANTIDTSIEDGKLSPEELKLIGQQLRSIADTATIERIKGVIQWAALRTQQS